MPDRYRKVAPGRPLEIPADAWNAFLDSVRDLRGRQHSALAEALDQYRQGDIIKVRNESNNDRNRFHVLGIDEPIIKPDDHLREFKNQVALTGLVPKYPKHFGRFVLLLEPLREGEIGRAHVSGVCPAYVDIEDECHQCADVKHKD